MKKLLVISMLVLSSLMSWSQKSADLGVQFGAATYWGDIEDVDYSKAITPIVGVLGRWNFNNRLALRGQLVAGGLKAEGLFPKSTIGQPFTKDATGTMYELDTTQFYNFDRTFQSFEILFEFNFRNYQMGNMKKERFSPFVFVGLGGFFSRSPRRGTLILEPFESAPGSGLYYPYRDADQNKSNDADAASVIIPVGIGIKYNISKNLGAVAELSVKKTFTDNIDNLDDPKRFQDFDPVNSPTGTYPDSFADDPVSNSDWYSTLTLSLYYRLWTSKGNCRIYEKNLKRNGR